MVGCKAQRVKVLVYADDRVGSAYVREVREGGLDEFSEGLERMTRLGD
jgi:hypothetical protein